MKGLKSTVIARFTPEERDAIRSEAKALGISLSEFVRRACTAEIGILRQQRAIREAQRQARLMPQGTTHGNVSMTPAQIVYVYE